MCKSDFVDGDRAVKVLRKVLETGLHLGVGARRRSWTGDGHLVQGMHDPAKRWITSLPALLMPTTTSTVSE